jgi:diguanylate cyclase (GGDEF)-like protein
VIRNDVDLAFRFGGDEFAMLLFCDGKMACHKAMEVLSLMNGKVSIGIATLPREDAQQVELEEFIHTADDALYEAKRAGRGRVVLHGCTACGSAGCQQLCPEPGVYTGRAA